MICYTFDDHPFLKDIREIMSNFDPNLKYILIASPLYSFPSYFIPVQNYIFFSSPDDLHHYTSYGQNDKKILVDNKSITLQEGFPKTLTIPIFNSISSTTSSDAHIEIIEPDTDIYNPIPHPNICDTIDKIKDNSELSRSFLSSEFNYPQIKLALEQYNSEMVVPFFLSTNIPEIIKKFHSSLEKISKFIFSIPYIQVLPIYTKNSLNELIFNALTGSLHSRLLKAYHKQFSKENKIAKLSIQNRTNQKDDNLFNHNIIEKASSQMNIILDQKTTLSSIHSVFSFFQTVVNGINNQPACSDDIISALIEILGKNEKLSSYVYSLFSYLNDIWPSELSDSISYALITCYATANYLIQPPDQS